MFCPDVTRLTFGQHRGSIPQTTEAKSDVLVFRKTKLSFLRKPEHLRSLTLPAVPGFGTIPHCTVRGFVCLPHASYLFFQTFRKLPNLCGVPVPREFKAPCANLY